MISFKNKEQIREWVATLKNNVTLMEAHLKCEERQCSVVEKTTDGFVHKTNVIESAKSIKNCADMVVQYLK